MNVLRDRRSLTGSGPLLGQLDLLGGVGAALGAAAHQTESDGSTQGDE